MRISTSTLFESSVTTLNQQQSRLLQTQQQISTGRRILVASDDPVASAIALDVSQSDLMNTQYAANRGAARDTLSMAESSLQNVTSLLQDVRTAVINAGNGTLNNSDRNTIATQLSGRLQELVGLANSTDGVGNYLFAGFQSRAQPFMDTPAGVSYFGDDGQRAVQVSASRQMDSSNPGSDIFMRIKNGNGTFVTRADPANIGSGTVSIGNVFDSAALTGDSYTIEFDTWSTLAAAGNTGTGVISTASVIDPTLVTNQNYTVTFDLPAGATYTVTTDFPVPGSPLVPPLAGQAYVSGQTITFDQLQFNIQGTPNAGDVFTVSPPVPDTYTVTNDKTGLPVTGMMVQPYVSGQAISFDGMRIDIQGKPHFGDRFTVSPSTNESVFKTISDLITVLQTPVTVGSVNGMSKLANSLNISLNNLDNALGNILSIRSTLGLRLNEVDSLQMAGEDLSLQFKQTLSELQDVDYNQAISNLMQQQMSLQASQQTFTRVAQLSMFDYI